MSDFDDGDGFDVFQNEDETPADRPLGLVVGPKARVIRNAKGELLWDELAALERAHRVSGGKRVAFEEGDDDRET